MILWYIPELGRGLSATSLCTRTGDPTIQGVGHGHPRGCAHFGKYVIYWVWQPLLQIKTCLSNLSALSISPSVVNANRFPSSFLQEKQPKPYSTTRDSGVLTPEHSVTRKEIKSLTDLMGREGDYIPWGEIITGWANIDKGVVMR